jgi:acyl carrier protein
MDESHGLCPIGVKGNIMVSGVGVGRGYLNQPEKTSAAFLKDPFDAGKTMRMYCTGDVGRWLPDGNIEFFGRKDNQVKINGHRIELGEIESRLVSHPEIKEAVVLARERQGDKYLAGYYVSDIEIPMRELSKYLSIVLPDYMLPACYVHMHSIPLTVNGKADHKRLPEPDIAARDNYSAPANEVEEQLLEIWSDVLKISKEDISVNKSFFELGGNSLNAIKLTGKISQQLNINLKLADLYNRNSIRDLAGNIMIIKQIQIEHRDVDDIIEVRI